MLKISDKNSIKKGGGILHFCANLLLLILIRKIRHAESYMRYMDMNHRILSILIFLLNIFKKMSDYSGSSGF